MLECAFYGLTTHNFIEKSKRYIVREKIYAMNNKKIYSREWSPETTELIMRETPDRNKQKTCVVTNVHKTKVLSKNADQFLKALGHTFVSERELEVWITEKNGYKIEVTKVYGSATYLVKVFVETDDVVYGESLINKASIDLEGYVKLSRPALECFL